PPRCDDRRHLRRHRHHDVRRPNGGRFRQPPPDGEDAGAGLPPAGRHGIDRRRRTLPHPARLHLLGDRFLRDDRGVEPAGAPQRREAQGAMIAYLTDPGTWAALATLTVLEVILGVDNLVFLAIVSSRLPQHAQRRARAIGLALALVLRVALLTSL